MIEDNDDGDDDYDTNNDDSNDKDVAAEGIKTSENEAKLMLAIIFRLVVM